MDIIRQIATLMANVNCFHNPESRVFPLTSFPGGRTCYSIHLVGEDDENMTEEMEGHFLYGLYTIIPKDDMVAFNIPMAGRGKNQVIRIEDLKFLEAKHAEPPAEPNSPEPGV